MTTFRVWAPTPEVVEVELGGRRVAMDGAGRSGWRRAEVPEARAGDDYWLVVDGDRLPDPRSGWQPEGVHGPSRLVDHHAFPWTDQAWRGVHLPSAVFYELHVGTFTASGTFDSAIAALDHVVGLGADVVELMPVVEFAGERGWGYDGVDLFAPHHAYGGPDGLKRLVDACHARGLGVVLDVVYNHLGPDGNHLARFGPYFNERHTTLWGPAVNFDGPDSDEVRRFVIDNALSWLGDYHCDGLRLDAVHAIVDTSATSVLEELAVRVDELAATLGRPLSVVAESDLNDPRLVRRREVGGMGLDAQWSDDFHHALHAALTGERSGYYADFGTMAHLATALRQAFVFDGRYSPHRRRAHGRLDPALPGRRFLGYLQNHDQVGNRARGERSSALMSAGRLKVGAALVLTAPFLPLLFAGEEWGATTPFLYFTDHHPELGDAVRRGRREEFAAFGWAPEDVPDPQDPASFDSSKLDWNEPARSPHDDLLEWYRRLIELRRRTPALNDGRLDRVRVDFDESRRWLVMERAPVTVAANIGDQAVRLELGEGPTRLLLASDGGVALEGGAVALPSDSVAVLGP